MSDDGNVYDAKMKKIYPKYSARRLIGSLSAESKVITLTAWFN